MSSDTPTGRKIDITKLKGGGVAIPLTLTKKNTSGATSIAMSKPIGWTGPPQVVGPSSKTVSPFGSDAVMPGFNNNNNPQLNGEASKFEPTKNSVMDHLLRGSTTDDNAATQVCIVNSTGPSVTVSNKKAGKQPSPVGTRGIDTPCASPERVQFTTDNGQKFVGGHYVRIAKVSLADFEANMQDLSRDFDWESKVLGQQSSTYTESQKSITLYVCFDDIRAAAQAEDDVDVVNQEWHCQYIYQPEYAAAGGRMFHGTKEDTTFFDGQVIFVVRFNGDVATRDVKAAQASVCQLAENYGEVLAFADITQDCSPELEFRCEFYKISAARECINKLNDMDPHVCDDWAVMAKKLPEPVGTLVDPNTTPRKTVDGTTVSPSGRTAWSFDEDGRPIVQKPLRILPKVTNFKQLQGDYEVVGSTYRGRYHSAPVIQPTGYEVMEYTQAPRANTWAANPGPASTPRPASDQNEPQAVKVGRIVRGEDVRTTVMLRNLPNKWSIHDFKAALDSTSFGMYDFSYLRIDFEKGTNVGYGFVNFTQSDHIVDFYQRWIGREWIPGNYPRKIAQISYATIQGLDCLIEKFRNSAIMDEYKDFIPKLWYTTETPDIDPSQIGYERPFPSPNNHTKKQRSNDNASSIGLYAPRSGQRGGDRSRRSNYDRGTTHQMQEDAMYSQQSPTAVGFGYDGNYALAGRPPVGAPPFAPLVWPGYAPVNPYFAPGNQYAAPYADQYYPPYAAPGYPFQHTYPAPPHPGGYAPFQTSEAPPVRMRTSSRSRLHPRPQNVVVSPHGYCDVDRPVDAPVNTQHVPRSFMAAAQQDTAWGNSENYHFDPRGSVSLHGQHGQGHHQN